MQVPLQIHRTYFIRSKKITIRFGTRKFKAPSLSSKGDNYVDMKRVFANLLIIVVGFKSLRTDHTSPVNGKIVIKDNSGYVIAIQSHFHSIVGLFCFVFKVGWVVHYFMSYSKYTDQSCIFIVPHPLLTTPSSY